MRTTKRLIAIIALSIFVSNHILPLHNAISDCFVDNSVKNLKFEYQAGMRRIRLAEKALDDAEKTDKDDFVREYIIKHIGIGMGTAAIGSGLTGGITLGPALFIGYVTGLSTGTVIGTLAYYDAIDKAKKELENAKSDFNHIKEHLQIAKNKQADETIKPRETQISIFYTPTHHIDIETDDPIKAVEVWFTAIDGDDIFSKKEKPTSYTSSVTISHKFAEYKEGKYWVSVSVEVYGQEDSINKTYEIEVGK